MKGRAETLATFEYGNPRQTGLEAFESDSFEDLSISANLDTPFFVVIFDVNRVIV
jgi:hypothetical protein